jgi:hypothetical protein
LSPAYDPADLISIEDAAALRGTTRQAISGLVSRGRLKFTVAKLLLRSDVANFKEEKRGAKPKPKPKKKRATKKESTNGRR